MEPSCFLIWNVRGLNDRSKIDSVKSLVLDIKPSILQETKLCCISDFDILSILGSRLVILFVAQLKGPGEGF
jgi:hypothetical protein